MSIVFDSIVLACVSDELSTRIVDCRIERVTQPDPFEIVLKLYGPTYRGMLLASCNPHSARLHLTEKERTRPPQPLHFCQLLRKYLEGSRISAVANPLGFGERVLHLHVATPTYGQLTLVLEIMGRHSNIVLIDSRDMVLGAAKHITHDINRFRETVPGRTYVDPPRQKLKRDPMRGHLPDGSVLEDEKTAAEWLMDRFSGVSPLAAREAVARAERPLTTTSLWNGFDSILEIVRQNGWTPIVWRDENGLTAGAYPISLASVPQTRQRHLSSISLALDEVADAHERDSAFISAKEALVSAIHRARRARSADLESVQQGIHRSEQSDWLQECGDLILNNQHQIVRGDSATNVLDYYRSSEERDEPALRTIDLDPALDVRSNAERYFKKSRKARDSKEMLLARRIELERAIQLLQEAELAITDTITAQQVSEIRNSITAHLNRPDIQDSEENEEKRLNRAQQFEGHKIKVYHSVDGFEILVGENATSNDFLTTRIAAGSDIWLHVRAAASAHGVIRTHNHPGAVGPATIQQAAELVAARSESKHSSLIPVDYTLKKYVRKPRKSAAGAVFYQNEKTIYVVGISGQ